MKRLVAFTMLSAVAMGAAHADVEGFSSTDVEIQADSIEIGNMGSLIATGNVAIISKGGVLYTDFATISMNGDTIYVAADKILID